MINMLKAILGLLLIPIVMTLADRAERAYWKEYQKKMGYK